MQSTLKRENILPTSFNNMLAIPPVFDLTATKTTVAIINNQKSICWQDSSVFIIILLALSKGDREKSCVMFDSLVGLFSHVNEVKFLTKAINCQDFIDCLNTLIIE